MAVSTTSKSPKAILLTALSVGQAKLADYSHRNSPKKFTQPQLFACLVLKSSLGLDYRGLEGPLDETALLRAILGSLHKGDIAVMDRYYCSFMLLALLQSQGTHACARKHHLRQQSG